jgi:uncharacterized protein YegL
MELEKAEVMYPEEPRCALVLLLDVSSSMGAHVEDKRKISELNRGIKTLKEELIKDDLAKKRVEIAIVTFGGDDEVKELEDFSPVEHFNPPEFEADGITPMGKAILRAVKLIDSRKHFYKSKGIDYYRPWIWLITDGMPTDMNVGDKMWANVDKAVHEGLAGKKFLFFAIGVGDADMEMLNKISLPDRAALKLKGAKFGEMFDWLSKSMKGVSASKVGEQVKFESPIGWGEAEI